MSEQQVGFIPTPDCPPITDVDAYVRELLPYYENQQLSVEHSIQMRVFRYKMGMAIRKMVDMSLNEMLAHMGLIEPQQWWICECATVFEGWDAYKQYQGNPELIVYANRVARADCGLCNGMGMVHEPIPGGRCNCTSPYHQPSIEVCNG